MLNISNIRLGHACNSSSSHSLVLINGSQNIKDKLAPGAEFGWDDFVLATYGSKLEYTAAQLYSALINLGYPEQIAQLVVKEWSGVHLPRNAYVDHQSVWLMPVEDGKMPCRSYFDELKDFVLDQHIVIFGGNDNDDRPPRRPKGTEIKIPKGYHGAFFKARRDGDYWVMYNQQTGGKIRFSFKTTAPYEKASVPELVDISITDFCDRGCPFCYRDSNANGQHADVHDLERISYAFKDLGVFEVALGGGEPLSHPGFDEIVAAFHGAGITTNVTTRLYKNMSEFAFRRLRAVATTVFNSYDVKNFYDWWILSRAKYNTTEAPALFANVVLGTVSPFMFESVLRACSVLGIQPVILGYKECGRGDSYGKTDYDWWLDSIKENGLGGWFHIDTVVAKEFDEQLKEAGVYPIMYSISEGKFSMFIDAVNKKAGPSSYHTDQLVDFSSRTNDIIQFIRKEFPKW